MAPVNENIIQRVAAYVRVSTTEQRLRGLSPDAQRDALTTYAEKHNLKIVEWYEDLGVSGTKPIKKRPALQQMIKDAVDGKFDRIIFIKLDRYFRSVAEYYECQKQLEAKNVTWTATEELYDLTTANGRYWVTQKLAIAELEAGTTGERIDLVNEYKIKTGQPLTGAQSLGYAYSIEKNEDGTKKVVKDPNTKHIVEDFIQYYLLHQNKRQSAFYIQQKYNSDVSYKTLSKVLRDSKIYGYYKGNPNYCEPYIDKETFDLIQEMTKNNIKATFTKRIYLFTGMIRCPHCGHPMGGKFTGKSTSQNKPGGKIYTYFKDYYSYRCNEHYGKKVCDFNKNPNEQTIEKHLIENLDLYVDAYISEIGVEDAREKKDDCVKKKLTELRGQLQRVNRMYKLGKIDDAEYDKDSDDLEEQIRDLENHLEPLTERDLTEYEELLKSDWKTLYNALNKENKRAFWRKYVKQILLNEDGTVNRVIFF